VLTATVQIKIPSITEVAVGSLRGLNGGGLIVQSSFFPFVIMPDIVLCQYAINLLTIVMNSTKEVCIMGKYITIIAIPIALFAFLLFSPLSAEAQFGFGPKQVQKKSHQAILSTTQGRFVFGQVSESSEDKFMLDTFTGRLWRLNKRTNVGLCLTVIPYYNKDGKCSSLPPKTPALQGKGAKEK